jgi:hypothetical protein
LIPFGDLIRTEVALKQVALDGTHGKPGQALAGHEKRLDKLYVYVKS